MKTSLALLVNVVGLIGLQSTTGDVVRNFSQSKIIDESAGPTANVSAGDLDGDGDLDLVLAKGRHWEASDRLLINDGRGHFTARDLGTAKDASYSALLADVDGDRDLDVIVTNDNEPGRVYLNDGKAHFQAAIEWGLPKWPTRNGTIADLNGDGRPDVIAANRSPETGRRSHFCLNDGTGHFSACTELAVGRATSIVAADFDRDGHVDLAVPERDGGDSLILYNDGKAGFARTRRFGPSTTAARVAAAADLNSDGWPDLVVGDERISTFVYLNDTKGALQSGLQLKFDGLPAPYAITIGDLDRDRHADIVIGHAGERGSVLFGDGTGRTFRHVRFGEGSDVIYGIALGDMDGDGYDDIVAARDFAPTTLFFNRSGPTIDRIIASDKVVSPRWNLRPASAEQYKLGIWRGLATHTFGQQWDLELRLNTFEPGQTAGMLLDSSNGVAYCGATLLLLEHKPNESALFRATGCWSPSALARARWLSDGRIELELWDERGLPNQRWKAILVRDR
jgi:hypothetical protein